MEDLLEPSDQVVLFMYLLAKGLPEWAEGDPVLAFSKLLNWTYEESQRAFEDCRQQGFIEKK